VKEISRHDDDRRVIDVVEKVEELADRSTLNVGSGREGEVAHHVDVMTVRDRDGPSFH
jgi:hypothetical protein